MRPPATPATTPTQEKILEAATACFNELGFGATRIVDISERAGIGKGTVYEYYRSKEALLLAACLHSCQAGETETERLHDELIADDAHPVRAFREMLRTVLTLHLGQGRKDQRLFHELSIAACSHPELGDQAAEEFRRKLDYWRLFCRTAYERARDAGFFRELADPPSIARVIVAMVDGLIWQAQLTRESPPEKTAVEVADAVCRMLLQEPDHLEEFVS